MMIAGMCTYAYGGKRKQFIRRVKKARCMYMPGSRCVHRKKRRRNTVFSLSLSVSFLSLEFDYISFRTTTDVYNNHK